MEPTTARAIIDDFHLNPVRRGLVERAEDMVIRPESNRRSGALGEVPDGKVSAHLENPG